MSVGSFLAAVLSIAFGAVGQLFLKLGAERLGAAAPGGGVARLVAALAVNWPLALGLSLYAASAVVWVLVLSRVNLSVAYPMIGLGFVIVLGLSVAVLGERVAPLQLLGCVLIVTGIALVTRGSG